MCSQTLARGSLARPPFVLGFCGCRGPAGPLASFQSVLWLSTCQGQVQGRPFWDTGWGQSLLSPEFSSGPPAQSRAGGCNWAPQTLSTSWLFPSLFQHFLDRSLLSASRPGSWDSAMSDQRWARLACPPPTRVPWAPLLPAALPCHPGKVTAASVCVQGLHPRPGGISEMDPTGVSPLGVGGSGCPPVGALGVARRRERYLRPQAQGSFQSRGVLPYPHPPPVHRPRLQSCPLS